MAVSVKKPKVDPDALAEAQAAVIGREAGRLIVTREWGLRTYLGARDARDLASLARQEDERFTGPLKAVREGESSVVTEDGTVLFTVQKVQPKDVLDVARLAVFLAAHGATVDMFMVTPEPTERLILAKDAVIPAPRQG
jgi:hypothetical protein